MQLCKIVFVVCLCGVVLSAPSKNYDPKVSFPKNVEGLHGGLGISGGSIASIRSFPYQAAVLWDYYFIGSGTIVGKKFILANALLVSGAEPSDLQVRVGSASSSEGGQVIKVEKIIVHENYNQYYSYDVALLKLSKAIKYGKTAKAIKLATKEAKNTTSAVVSGYGYSNPLLNLGEDYGTLQKGKQNVIDRASCETVYSGIIFDDSNTCAYSPTVCPCNYDFGDPLVQGNKLLGYFSGGSWCCSDNKPQIYTNVPGIRKWIKKQMKEEGYNNKEDIDQYCGDEE